LSLDLIKDILSHKDAGAARIKGFDNFQLRELGFL
jgi:hypothetical protein